MDVVGRVARHKESKSESVSSLNVRLIPTRKIDHISLCQRKIMEETRCQQDKPQKRPASQSYSKEEMLNRNVTSATLDSDRLASALKMRIK